MHEVFAAVLAAAVASQPVGATEPPTLAGVWDGTVGGLQIRACFNEPDYRAFGSYYYESRLQLIYLRQLEGDPSAYVEGYPWEKNNPRWTVDEVKANQITGRWLKGQRSLPFHLSRVPGPPLGEDETPCSSKLFHQPRIDGIRVVGKAAAKDGVRYTRLVLEYPDHTAVGVETFALNGGSPATRRINGKLRKPFEGNPPEWHDCELVAAGGGSNGGWDESYEPAMFTRRWLSVRQHVEAYCGGPHPDSWNATHTFDLQTGNEVDLSKWFNKSVGRPQFTRLMFANWSRGDDPDCREVVEQSVDAFALDIELKPTGLAFTPKDLPHVVAACGDDFFIPFAKLAPYLTPDGRKNVVALRAEFASRR